MALTLNGTTGISGIAGSAGTPALQGNNDTNTGYFFGTDILGLSTGGTERLHLDAGGRISNSSFLPANYGSPNVLISGTDSTITLMGNGSTNSTSFTGIKFRVAGTSQGDYTKAGIFSRREGGYNDLSLIFALDTVADATSVSIADEKMRITSGGEIRIGGNEGGYKLNVIDESNRTTTAETALHLYAKHDGSGTTGAGFGTGIRFWGDRASGNIEQNMGRIMCIADVNSGTNISGALVFETGIAGVLAEKLRITSSGNLHVGRTADYWNSRATFQEDKNGRTQILVKNDNNHADASSSIALNAYGNSWVMDCGSSLKNTNGLTFRLDASSATPAEKLRLTTSGTLNLGGQYTNTAHSLSVNKSDGNCIAIGNTSGSSNGSHNAQIVATDGTYFNNLKLTGQEVKIFTNVSGGTGITETWKFDTDGNFKCSNAGKGISFINAADVASGETVSSSVLDDYEEGSFTPNYDAPNQAGATFAHNHAYGYYTKVGNIVSVTVYIQGYCNGNAGGGANDDLKIINLPFTVASLPGSGASNRHVANFAIGSRYKLECDDLTAYAYGGNTYIDLLVPGNGTTGTMLKTNQADQNTTQFWGTATYRVA